MGVDWNARKMTFRPMPILTLLSVISLVILTMLGTWQYDRYSEKIANPVSAQVLDETKRYEFAIDRNLDANVQQVYGLADSEPIWRRYAPGTDTATGQRALVLIEATGGASGIPAPLSSLPETVAFEGVVSSKPRSGGAFDVKNNPELDQWYSLEPELIWAHLGYDGVPMVAEPIVMTVRNAADLNQSRLTGNPYAFSQPIDPLPPERHFGYALTWWGMALALIGVYVALHRSQGRLKF